MAWANEMKVMHARLAQTNLHTKLVLLLFGILSPKLLLGVLFI